MSEYKTLDSWFPDGKPDGRKFRTENFQYAWFQPFFRGICGGWFGLADKGNSIVLDCKVKVKIYKPEPKTKKVKMYRPVYRGYDGSFTTFSQSNWHSAKGNCWDSNKDNWDDSQIVGWMETEAEVYE